MKNTLQFILNMTAAGLAAAAGAFLAESRRKKKESADDPALRFVHERLGKALDLADEAYDKAEMYRRAYYSLKSAAYEKGIEIKDEVVEDDVYFDYGYLRDRMDLV